MKAEHDVKMGKREEEAKVERRDGRSGEEAFAAVSLARFFSLLLSCTCRCAALWTEAYYICLFPSRTQIRKRYRSALQGIWSNSSSGATEAMSRGAGVTNIPATTTTIPATSAVGHKTPMMEENGSRRGARDALDDGRGREDEGSARKRVFVDDDATTRRRREG